MDPGAIIKISDFGLAKMSNAELMLTACGTPGYVAPEIIKGDGYGKEIDYWSIGVILYIMLCGFPPFYADTNKQLFELILQCKYEFLSPYWDGISDMAKDLIKHLLVVDPKKRYTANEIMEHTWMKGEKTPRTQLPHITTKISQYYKDMKDGVILITRN